MGKTERCACKEPWLAVVLSRLLTGAGQIYSGKIFRGVFLIFLEILLTGISFWFVFSDKGNIIIGAILLLLLGAINIWNLFDAHKCARAKNTEDFEISRKHNKDPWLSVFLSLWIPGLGHLYIKKLLWGITFVILFLIISLITKKHPILIGVNAFLTSYVCYQGYLLSQIHRERTQKMILIIAILILVSGLLNFGSALTLRKYYVEASRIRTDIMSPTLKKNDRVMVYKTGLSSLKRGDVVVFRYPESSDIPDLSRLMAFEGETIEIKDEKIYINGELVNCPCVQNIKYQSVGLGAEGNPFLVPDGCYFVLCDNSSHIRDSRFYGAITSSKLIGKVYKRYWPINRMGFIK